MSSASAAVSVSLPYAFCAAAAVLDKASMSPSPAAEAFETCSNVSNAFAPLNPAEVKKNKPSANSTGDFPEAIAKSKTESFIF